MVTKSQRSFFVDSVDTFSAKVKLGVTLLSIPCFTGQVDNSDVKKSKLTSVHRGLA